MSGDIFDSNAFTSRELTASINNPPEGQMVPTIIDSLFMEEGIATTVVEIEREGQTLALVEARERGTDGQVVNGDPRTMLPFKCLHLPQRATIKADEVQNVRAFGSKDRLQTVVEQVNKRLMKMRKQLDATIRFHRMGVIKGTIYDANGTRVLLNVFDAFGLTQQTKAMALTTDATKVRTKVIEAKRLSEDVIADSGTITGWLCLCGRDFFTSLIDHDDVRDAYQFYSAQVKSTDPRRSGFSFADVEWREYYGKVGNQLYIGADDAYLIPLGVDDLLITRFAPADYEETVNTVGLPYYAKQEPMRFAKGRELEAQSNPLNLCTKPRAIIKLTKV